MTENNQRRRGRPANEALGQTILDAASELFVELGFQATTLDKVAHRAKISKLSIYRHFENKEALFSAAMAAGCHEFTHVSSRSTPSEEVAQGTTSQTVFLLRSTF